MLPEREKGIVLPHFRNEDDKIVSLYLSAHGTEGFAQKPFDTVSLHAFAVPLAHGNAHVQLLRGGIDHRQGRGKRAPAPGKQFIEIRLFFQAQVIYSENEKSRPSRLRKND